MRGGCWPSPGEAPPPRTHQSRVAHGDDHDGRGDIIVYTNIFNPSLHPGANVYDATNRRELWRSGAMNANAVVESAILIGNAYGIEVSMPNGARLTIYTPIRGE